MAGESGGHPECAWRACVTPLGLGALERQQCLCSVTNRFCTTPDLWDLEPLSLCEPWEDLSRSNLDQKLPKFVG